MEFSSMGFIEILSNFNMEWNEDLALVNTFAFFAASIYTAIEQQLRLMKSKYSSSKWS